jgi:hypothetical protein
MTDSTMTYLLRLYTSYMKVALLSMFVGTCAFFVWAGFTSGSSLFYISMLMVLGIGLSAVTLIKVYSKVSLISIFIVVLLPVLLLVLVVVASNIGVLLIIIWNLLGAAIGVLRYKSRSESFGSSYRVRPTQSRVQRDLQREKVSLIRKLD